GEYALLPGLFVYPNPTEGFGSSRRHPLWFQAIFTSIKLLFLEIISIPDIPLNSLRLLNNLSCYTDGAMYS
ncbi:MAG: hypothetical protein M1113_04885, partial [Candidatus Thermoplasmatota archaeon]|nr:hypothetical protein [Candidatus Thermoplasmatota archaeon]